MLSNNPNNLLHQQQSQNEVKNSKLHHYQEKRPKSRLQHNDELLDSAILNNFNNDELNSPKDSNRLFPDNKSNQLLDMRFFNNIGLPSAHSNNLNIIMNSDNMQQSDIQSTMTIYNSGIFDEASIMRVLDKSISDESLFFHQQTQEDQKQQSQIRSGVELEQSFKFECEDVKQILVNVSTKLKEKLQKQRSIHA